MVIPWHFKNRAVRECGALMTEAVLGLTLLTLALIPLSFSVVQERKLAKAYYQRAILVELLDGEMEVLVAGGWRHFKEGTNAYSVRGHAVTNLPAGHFALVLQNKRILLEWKPEGPGPGHQGYKSREVFLP